MTVLKGTALGQTGAVLLRKGRHGGTGMLHRHRGAEPIARTEDTGGIGDIMGTKDNGSPKHERGRCKTRGMPWVVAKTTTALLRLRGRAGMPPRTAWP